MIDQAPDTHIDRAATGMIDALTRIFGEATPGTVFTAPERVGDAVVISAAAWERGGGFGFGGGTGDEPGKGRGSGAGGGGGGGFQGRPVAVIRIDPNGLQVTPVIDFTKIGVTALLSAIGLWRALRR
jgi:uncharacterized spore protein YtfJ